MTRFSLRKKAKNTWLWNFTNTSQGKYTKFFVLLLLDTVNLAVDWSLYVRIQLIRPGLVYGPPSEAIKLATFTFCMISVCMFVIETIQNADDLLVAKQFPFLSQSTSNFLMIFFEDIPLLVLNLLVTLCLDGEPSIVAQLKASICIVAVFVRLVVMTVVFWLLTKGKKTRFHLTLDALSTIGLISIAILSIGIQLCRTLPVNSAGNVFHSNKFNQMEYAKSKYLNDVGIYLEWPIIEKSSDHPDHHQESKNSSSSSNLNSNKYLWLVDVNTVIDRMHLSIEIQTDESEEKLVCVNNGQINKQHCYSIDQYPIRSTPKTAKTKRAELTTTYLLDFSKEPSQMVYYKIGYIDYNLNRVTDSSCQSLKLSPRSLTYAKFPAGLKSSSKNVREPMRPFFFEDDDDENKSSSSSSHAFYSYDYDLMPMEKTCRTGMFMCKMSGDLGPKFNPDIRLFC